MEGLRSRKIEGIRESDRDRKKKFDPKFSVEENIEMGNISKEEAMEALEKLFQGLDAFAAKQKHQ